MNNLIEEIHQNKVDIIINLAKICLDRFQVKYTENKLKKTAIECFLVTFSYTKKEQFDYYGEETVMDVEEPSNLALCLLEILRSYNIKNSVSEQKSKTNSEQLLVILKKDESKSSIAQHLLFVKDVNELNLIQEEEDIEFFISLSKTGHSEEPNFKQNLKEKRVFLMLKYALTGILLGVLSLAIINGLAYPIISWIPLFTLLLSGILISYSLFQLEKNNTYISESVKKICKNDEKSKNCSEVISSNGSKLFGIISMTDIGVVYFSTFFIMAIIGILGSNYFEILNLLFWIALIPLPYSIYSIYHQFFIIRTICTLCLLTQTVIWLLFISFLILFDSINIFQISIQHLTTFIAIGLLISSIYLLYLKYRNLNNRNFQREIDYRLLLNDTSFFNFLLEQKSHFKLNPLKGTINFEGNRNENKITTFLSFECVPCAKKLKDIIKLIEWFKGDISFQIFLIPNPRFSLLHKKLIDLSIHNNTSEALNLLSDWYENLLNKKTGQSVKMLFSNWKNSQNLEVNKDDKHIVQLLDEHEIQFKKLNINYAPFLIYNDIEIPDEYYDYNNLRMILDAFLEEVPIEGELV